MTLLRLFILCLFHSYIVTASFALGGDQAFMRKNEDDDLNFKIFFQPFSSKVWFTFHGLWLMYACILYFISFLNEKMVDSCKPRENFSFFESIVYFSLASIQLGADKHPVSIGGKMLQYGWSIFLLILVATYTASLAAFFSNDRFSYPLQSIDEIGKSNRKIAALESNRGNLKNMENEILDELLIKKRIEFFNLTNPVDWEILVEEKLSSGYIWIENDANIDHLKKVVKVDSYKLDGYFSLYHYGFAIQRDWRYADNVTKLLAKYSHTGLVDQIARRYKKGRFSETNKKTSKSLQWASFSGIFVIMFIVGFAVAVFTIMEFCWTNRKGNKALDKKCQDDGQEEMPQ